MKLLVIPLCFLTVISNFSIAQGTWIQRANFSGASRTTAASFSIGNYGYIGTGFTGVTVKDFWQYEPSNNMWTQKADFGGTARRAAIGFSIGNKGYIGTGLDLNNVYTKDFWEYDPTANTWTKKADFPGAARYYATGFSTSTKGYIGIGMNGTQAFTDFYEYNPTTDTWTMCTNFPGTARANAFGMAINEKGYVGCGRNFSGTTFYSSVYEYDPVGNTWTSKAAFAGTPGAREGMSTFVIGNYGYAGLGSTSNFGTQYKDFFRYDPTTDSWSAIATFAGTQRTNAASFAIGNFGYVGTGYTLGNYTITFWQYDLCGITTTVTPTPPSCHGGNNGSVNLTVSGGTPPLSYLWSNSSTLEDVTGLSTGTYTVIITDAAGCTKSATVTVTQPTALVGNITNTTNASCNSLCNGKINISASGATPPYTYVWSPNVSSTTSATGLCAANYSITIVDAKGCSVTLDTVITQPLPLIINTDSSNSSPPSSACICDGYITVTATGGTPSYNFLWSNGTTTPLITGLCSGTPYSVILTDSNGCTDTDTIAFSPQQLSVNISFTPATCFNCPDGSASANPLGGNPPYSYTWNNGQSTQTATGLTPGNYTVCVTDNDGCGICDSVYVGFSVAINEPTAYHVSISPNPSEGIFFISGIPISEIEIFNVIGEKIIPNLILRKENNIMVHISNYTEGIYFIKMESEQNVLTKKIILSR